MRESENGMVGWLWIVVLVICFGILVVSTAQAYSCSDYYDWDEDNGEGNDNLEYYDYRAGQWREIPEPDPYCYPVSYGYSRGHRSLSPISMMMPLFIIFFVIFLPWLAYALGRDGY